MKNRLIKPIIGSIAILFVLMYGCFNNAIQKNPLPVVDLTKEYPEKQVFVDGADTDYIALETTTEVLTDRDFRIEYVSDNRIAGINRQRGDIFVFDRNGRIISFFNHMGNSGIEYQFI